MQVPATNTAFESRIGVGIVGLSARGGWAAAAHLPALSALDGYEPRGLSASSAESAKAAGPVRPDKRAATTGQRQVNAA
jgi:predicted dehydrogenase